MYSNLKFPHMTDFLHRLTNIRCASEHNLPIASRAFHRKVQSQGGVGGGSLSNNVRYLITATRHRMQATINCRNCTLSGIHLLLFYVHIFYKYRSPLITLKKIPQCLTPPAQNFHPLKLLQFGYRILWISNGSNFCWYFDSQNCFAAFMQFSLLKIKINCRKCSELRFCSKLNAIIFLPRLCVCVYWLFLIYFLWADVNWLPYFFPA